MWNLDLPGGDVTVPVPETSVDRVVTMVTDFILRYPIPVTIFLLVFATIFSWKRWAVFRGLVIGIAIGIILLFVWRGAS